MKFLGKFTKKKKSRGGGGLGGGVRVDVNAMLGVGDVVGSGQGGGGVRVGGFRVDVNEELKFL